MKISDLVSKRSVQLGFLILCIAVRVLFPDIINELTFWLSVFAISLSLMILQEQNVDTQAVHMKLDEIDEGIPETDGDAIGIEKRL